MSKVSRYELQWDEETYTQAVEASGKIVLTNEQFYAFWDICENPPPPSPQILKAAKALDEEGFLPH